MPDSASLDGGFYLPLIPMIDPYISWYVCLDTCVLSSCMFTLTFGVIDKLCYVIVVISVHLLYNCLLHEI